MTLALFVCVMASGDQPATAESLKPFTPVSIEATADAGVFDLAGGTAGRQYLVVVGTPHWEEKGGVIRFDREVADNLEPLPVPDTKWAEGRRQTAAVRRDAMRLRRAMAAREPVPVSVGKIATRRPFHIFVKDGSFQDAGNYRTVTGALVEVGKHCVVYVDQNDDPAKFDRETVAETVRTFDATVFPKASEYFGRRRDVDRDGKFTILFSSVLGDLSDGRVSIGGFVRGGDFYRDVDPPFSNQCDMLYLNSNLKPGPHLRTLIAHEFVHAVTFCEHVFGEYLPGESGVDEEAWLNEAISHLAENLFGEGWSNLDYRVSAFLSAPQKYRLAVPDYYRAGLFRNHGCRGATYLFLRRCTDDFGNGFLKELTQSSLAGKQNLETAAGAPFAELFRTWTVGLAMQGFAPPETKTTVDAFGKLGDYTLAGARTPIVPAVGAVIPMEASSFMPLRVLVGPGENARIRLSGSAEGPLQITLVRLPDDAPMVELDAAFAPATGAKETTAARKALVRVRHIGGLAVKWDRLAWERETLPAVKEADDMPRPGVARADEVLPLVRTKRGDSVVSDPIEIAPALQGDLVFKLVGTDALGRRISAWATLGAAPPIRAALTTR